MNNMQRVIKYIAIAFGVFLTISIISAILSGVLFAGSIISGVNYFNYSDIGAMREMKVEGRINNIDIDLAIANLKIKRSEEFKIEYSSDKINIDIKNNTINIWEDNYRMFKRENRKITIYIPNEMYFENIKIKAGVGETNIEELIGNDVDFEFGVGATTIRNLISNNSTHISGGVGKIDISGGVIKNLRLESGVGESVINCDLEGLSNINNGIGRLELNLIKSENSYTIIPRVGIGQMTLNGNKCSSDRSYGTGENTINIEGGIGEIKIRTK